MLYYTIAHLTCNTKDHAAKCYGIYNRLCKLALMLGAAAFRRLGTPTNNHHVCCLQMLQHEGMRRDKAEEQIQQVNQDMQAIIGESTLIIPKGDVTGSTNLGFS